ncbi:superoxide dismutase [Candidatus Woesearchaeota archaeon]|jgi:superoxide dismutase, Fe-Mn family|nr:superoxide dismutase [Candidatus Woesearchaeota archaeon]MBT5215378.1 superoxide dismutase [Candidatus Woesearchaeota archaeon]MBT6401970.1 superoxide dismutase [Candidatus Woesearchaeota archaeon]
MEYKLPELNYGYDSLEPYYDKETLELHHTKHHAGYVAGLNNAVAKLKECREKGDYTLVKHWEKELAFHGAGHVLHSYFWNNLRSGSEDNIATGATFEAIEESFGSFDKFKEEFSKVTLTVEGSGWGVLAKGPSGDLKIFSVENHQKVFIPGYKILLVCDVWEHAYYLKYQNRRAEWIENFFKIINWEEVEKRL